VLVSAVSFGLMPIFARFAYAQGVGVDELLFLRFLLGFVIVGVILVLRGRLNLPSRMDLLFLILLGALVYFLQSFLYFTALLYSPVAIVALILYTYPVFVTIGALTLGWEKISGILAGASVIAILGLVLIANPFGSIIGVGIIFALGSSIFYTIYILSGSRVLRRVKGDVAVFYIMGGASVSFGVTGEVTGTFHLAWSPMGWFWVGMIVVVCTVLAITALFMGISKIGPSRAALISFGEPATAIFASLALFGNSLSGLQWFGGLLILIATAIITLCGSPALDQEQGQSLLREPGR